VIAAILEEGEAVAMERVLEFPEVTDTGGHPKRAMNAPTERRVVTMDDSGETTTVDFNVGGIEEIKAEQRRRDRREQIMNEILIARVTGSRG
jgi:hypothetical protein